MQKADTRKVFPRKEVISSGQPCWQNPVVAKLARLLAQVADILMESVLHIVVFLVPLLFTATTVENFLTPKEYCLRYGAHIIIFLYIAKILFTGRIRLAADPLIKIAWLICSYCILSILWTYNLYSTLRDIRDFILVVSLYFICRNNWDNKGFYFRILYTAIFSTFLVAFLAWMQAHNSFVLFAAQLKIPISRLNPKHTIQFFSTEERKKNVQPVPLSIFCEYAWRYYTHFGVKPGKTQKKPPDLTNLMPRFGKTPWEVFKYSLKCTFDGFNWTSPNVGGIISTFGNRNYMASFLAMMTFPLFSLWFYFISGWLHRLNTDIPRWMHYIINGFFLIILSLIIILFEYAILATRSRGGALSLISGFTFFLILFLLTTLRFNLNISRLLRYILGGSFLLGGFLLIILLQIVPNSLSIHSDSLGNKFASITKTTEYNSAVSNTLERLNVLRYTSKTIASSIKNFIFGIGFGSFRHVFPLTKAKYMPEKIKDVFSEVTFRQTHNDWLQFLQEFGIVGFFLFFLLVLMTFKKSYLFLLDNPGTEDLEKVFEKKLFFIGVFTALFCYILILNVDFSHHQIANGFYGLILFLVVNQVLASNFFERPSDEKILYLHSPPLNVVSQHGIIPLNIHMLFFFGIFIYYSAAFDAARWRADVSLKKGIVSIEQKKYTQAEKMLRDAIAQDKFLGDAWYRLAVAMTVIPEKRGSVDSALEQSWANINYNGRATYHSLTYQKLVLEHSKRNISEVIKWAKHGLFLTCGIARSPYYLILGKTFFDQNKLSSATYYLEKCLRFQQPRQQASLFLMNIYSRQKQWQKSIEVGRKLEGVPIYEKNAGFQQTKGIAYFNYGLALKVSKNNADRFKAEKMLRLGTDALKKASILAPNNHKVKMDYAVSLVKLGKIKIAISIFQELLKIKNLAPNLHKQAESILAECMKFLPRKVGKAASFTMEQVITDDKGRNFFDNFPKELLITFEKEKVLGILSLKDKKFRQTLSAKIIPEKILVNPVNGNIVLINKSTRQLTFVKAPDYKSLFPISIPPPMNLQDAAMRKDGRVAVLTNNIIESASGTNNIRKNVGRIFEITPDLTEDPKLGGQFLIYAEKLLVLNKYKNDVFLINPLAVLRANMQQKKILAQLKNPYGILENWGKSEKAGKLYAIDKKKKNLIFFNPENLKKEGHITLPALKQISWIFSPPETGQIIILDKIEGNLHIFDPVLEKYLQSVRILIKTNNIACGPEGRLWALSEKNKNRINFLNIKSGKSDSIILKMSPGQVLFLN
ncbi:O-antigen ligase family protein [Candidatus Riflebacteria bacterium]